MSDSDSHAVKDSDNEGSWPRTLNKALIGIGIIAFGLIITDRLINMFQADDLPEIAEISSSQQAAEPETSLELTEPAVTSNDASPIAAADDKNDPAVAASDEFNVDIEDVFGSRLVFVSASEPQYVVTEDERRIDLNGPIDEQTTLAGITSQQLILERDGNLLPVALPDLATD